MKKNFLVALFDLASETLNGGERAILDFLSAIVPYFVPVIPAYLTYFHTMNMMGFPSWVATTAAFVVEVLGMTAVATAIRFWRHNLRYKKDENKAPFKLAVATYLFYIVIVLAVNVILEIVAKTRGGWIILSIGLFSLLSIPSGVLISIRSQYREMLEDRRGGKAQTNQPMQLEAAHSEPRKKHASDYYEKIRAMARVEYDKNNRLLTPKEVSTALKLEHDKSKGYISQTLTDWAKENNIQKPPKNGLTF